MQAQLLMQNAFCQQRWVMIVNINPGCMFGGSATEYFVGDFDGKTFTCDDTPDVAKFLDYGKDHYATVTFYNAPDGRIAMTNLVFPTKPYNNLRFYSVGGQASFMNVKVYKLGM